MSLAEGEIDGLHKEPPPVRLGKHRDSNESNSDPDQSRRDVGKAGLVDANILFRGNSLLTKALDAHMKRLGREYLEETLGEQLREIAEEDTYCEVDPLRMEPGENLMKNWKILMGIVKGIWGGIYNSHEKCPMELRKILRHIRVCVEDRYGDLLKTVCYSSVCGFLFLRFFCPAILNPKLFGLLKGALICHPPPPLSGDNAKIVCRSSWSKGATNINSCCQESARARQYVDLWCQRAVDGANE